MSDLVPADQIENVVGARRHPFKHIASAVSAEQTVYILHPKGCFETRSDLRKCKYSLALDRGIDARRWSGYEDQPFVVGIVDGRLVPFVLADRLTPGGAG